MNTFNLVILLFGIYAIDTLHIHIYKYMIYNTYNICLYLYLYLPSYIYVYSYLQQGNLVNDCKVYGTFIL